ncbi:nSTAND1 domain-containing NTPase [Streptomyces sp. NPDC001107]
MPPYRGLARFEPGDAELFFGRHGLTDRVVALTWSRRFTAVFGP